MRHLFFCKKCQYNDFSNPLQAGSGFDMPSRNCPVCGTPLEQDGQDIPFEIKRVFYMYGSDPTIVRGQHANRKTEFVLINVSGTSKVKVDNGVEQAVIELNRPRMGLYLKTMLWKDMYDFSPDSVLLVLASEHYDGGEYIRDYEEYLKEIKK